MPLIWKPCVRFRAGESHYFSIFHRFDVQNSVLRCRQVERCGALLREKRLSRRKTRQQEDRVVQRRWVVSKILSRKFYQVFDLRNWVKTRENWGNGIEARKERLFLESVSLSLHFLELSIVRVRHVFVTCYGKANELLSSIFCATTFCQVITSRNIYRNNSPAL